MTASIQLSKLPFYYIYHLFIIFQIAIIRINMTMNDMILNYVYFQSAENFDFIKIAFP
jgi:hypothetical protein